MLRLHSNEKKQYMYMEQNPIYIAIIIGIISYILMLLYKNITKEKNFQNSDLIKISVTLMIITYVGIYLYYPIDKSPIILSEPFISASEL